MRVLCAQAQRAAALTGRALRWSQACRATASGLMEAPPKQLAVVRTGPDENNINICILLAGVQRSMRRAKQESLQTTLARIQTNAMPKAKKQKTKGGGRRSPSPHNVRKPTVQLLDGDSPIDGATMNEAAWRHGNLLQVGDVLYRVVRNPPTVDKVVVHGKPMVGYPLCPVPMLRYAQPEDCLWQWHRKTEGAWQSIPGANKLIYVPGEEDLGKSLRVACTPSGVIEKSDETWRGETVEVSVEVVTHGPKVTAGTGRHSLTERPLRPPGIRVLTYNLLADQYLATDYAQTHLFSYCPPPFREAEYRRSLALVELLGFNADILCLQEVDEKAFHLYFEPQLQAAGYRGFYTNKESSTREGCALFYSTAKYSCVCQRTFALKKIMAEVVNEGEAASKHTQLLPILRSSASLQHNLQQVATIAQMALLQPRQTGTEGGAVCVVNTHLFFHPRANHIRTIHTAAILSEAEAFIQENCPSGRQPAMLLCGDLNSGCNKGIPGNLELLGGGRLDANYWDWESGRTFRFVKDLEEQPPAPENQIPGSVDQGAESISEAQSSGSDEGFQSSSLAHSFQLASADRLRTPFTNYVKGFQSCLDYIWYDRRRLKVAREIPLPQEEELIGYIPSERFPSDHLSVVFDLEWQDPSNDVDKWQPQVYNRVFQADSQDLLMGVSALRLGGIVAVPTDTLYGVAADAEVGEGIRRLYAVKQRPASKPVAICVAKPTDVSKYGDTSSLPPGLLERLLPGPVTIVLSRLKDSRLSEVLNPGVSTIGIRVPNSPFILSLCESLGSALALTSANISGATSSLRVEDFRSIWHQCGAVFDAGAIPEAPAGSTIIDLTEKDTFVITRTGIAEASSVNILEAHGLKQKQPSNL